VLFRSQDERHLQGVFYNIWKPAPEYPPVDLEGDPVLGWPNLDCSVVFAHKAIRWESWVQTWRITPHGEPTSRLLEASIPILSAPLTYRGLPTGNGSGNGHGERMAPPDKASNA
jgi:hypothetical protein